MQTQITKTENKYYTQQANQRRQTLLKYLVNKNSLAAEDSKDCAVVGECNVSNLSMIYYLVNNNYYVFFQRTVGTEIKNNTKLLRKLTDLGRNRLIKSWEKNYNERKY